VLETPGFNDKKDGRSFSVDVPFGSFSDVQVSPTPLNVASNPIEKRPL
jgi:hypothetical protein